MLRLCRIVIDEYYGLCEKVVIESPFAEITEDGEGIRQVQLALTRKYILIGEDHFDKESTESLSNVYYKPDLESEVECMRLIEIIPLKAIRIKIYRRDKREILKIIAGNNTKVMYFEFGGHLLKRMFWIIWKDKIENMKISYNKYSKFPKYNDPYTEPETPLTSNSEYEMAKQFLTFADIHRNAKNVKNNDRENMRNIRNTVGDCDKENITSSIQETIQTIHRYFVDALTNSKLKILDKKAAYSVLKTNSDHDYIVDLSYSKSSSGNGTLNRKSVSTGLIRLK